MVFNLIGNKSWHQKKYVIRSKVISRPKKEVKYLFWNSDIQNTAQSYYFIITKLFIKTNRNAELATYFSVRYSIKYLTQQEKQKVTLFLRGCHKLKFILKCAVQFFEKKKSNLETKTKRPLYEDVIKIDIKWILRTSDLECLWGAFNWM